MTDARASVRTVVAAIVPRVATGDTILLAFSSMTPRLVACLYANLCSFVLDYAARQKVGGLHLKYNVFRQLPVLAPSAYRSEHVVAGSGPIVEWLLPRVLELTYTAWDLESFAQDVGYYGPPFRWDSDRRAHLRAELDAAFFHLYGLSRDDTDYVMESFPVVRRNDERAHGEFRTKRLILEVYDALSDAARSGSPYVSRLEPPPADPRVTHAARPDPAARPVGD
ncbi:MAG: hypothetical protein EPO40_08360 [Myxococcaceae bacterium]|nr:MAG: hypothetical protein EPO40_08360 [Myxococcaceae bacterium]